MIFLMCFFPFKCSGNCKYGVDLAKQLITSLYNVLDSCGSVRISFSRRTPWKVWYLAVFSIIQVGRLDSSTVCLQVADIVFKEFAGHPKVYIWNGEGRIWRLALSCSVFMLFAQLVELATMFTSAEPNPHMGHLAWADAFVITADSISMLSEACSTG